MPILVSVLELDRYIGKIGNHWSDHTQEVSHNHILSTCKSLTNTNTLSFTDLLADNDTYFSISMNQIGVSRQLKYIFVDYTNTSLGIG